MKVNVNLTNKAWKKTDSSESNKLKVLGHVFGLDKSNVALHEPNNIIAWASELKKTNGFYALVNQTDKKVFAAVDHIRSRPLFYGQAEGGFYLSDDADWVRQQVKDLAIDEEAKAEFQLTGYVTGRDTLYKNVKQLQAGECLAFTESGLELDRFYSFHHSEQVKYDEEQLRARLDQVAKKSIKRLIEYANGRQIVIPLSGGYDSRLIATILKEAGYENLMAFTYGKKNNKEAQYSKKVADGLGIKWCFVEYTYKLWFEAWRSEEAKLFRRFGSKCSSLPHVQDWLAVKIMKENKLVEQNCVFVPGHAADFLAGSHIPRMVFDNLEKTFDIKDACEEIFSRHYSATTIANVSFSKKHFIDKIKCTLEQRKIRTADDFVDSCENWNWQERQAKYIFNSVRVYEVFKYDWWVPLWDLEFISFFEDLPLKLRDHEWYKEYVRTKYSKISKSSTDKNIGNADTPGFFRKIGRLKFFKNLRIRILISQAYRLKVSPNSLLAFEGMFDASELEKLTKLGFMLHGITAFFFLKEEEDRVNW